MGGGAEKRMGEAEQIEQFERIGNGIALGGLPPPGGAQLTQRGEWSWYHSGLIVSIQEPSTWPAMA